MRTIFVFLVTLSVAFGSINGQNNYLVKTAAKTQDASDSKDNSSSLDDEFVNNNFKHYSLCDWFPGMKFMVIPERMDLIVSTFKLAETGKDVGSADLKYKIMEYQGVETTERGWLHFNFDCEGTAYYHEVKNITFADYCSNVKKGIKTLAYLGDVDIANEILIGQVLYTRTEKFYQDDDNSSNGFREVKLPLNTKVTVTAVGVGNRAFPVKVVFEDGKGISYYKEVAISKTNCGMLDSEFIMETADRTFAKSFSFSNPNHSRKEQLVAQYGNKVVYLKQKSEFNEGNKARTMPRFTQFTIKDIDVESGSNYVTLHLTDKNGRSYTHRITFNRESVIGDVHKSENYFEALYGMGNIKTLYPNISNENWAKIEQGEVSIGMTMTECRLALGDPIRFYKDPHSGVQDWIYETRVILSFKGNKLVTIK